jgi:peroxiredoxin (alkyl hydroperoxide reductase subunit C)
MSLVGRPAPDFTGHAVTKDGAILQTYTLSEAIKDKYAILVFYPANFTMLSASELVMLNGYAAELKERNIDVEIIAVSIDTAYSHQTWRNMTANENGNYIGPVNFTMIGDLNHEVIKAYDVESPIGVSYRAMFLIDKTGIIRHESVNDLALTRKKEQFAHIFDMLIEVF